MGRNNSNRNRLKKHAQARVKAIENNPHRHNMKKEITNMASRTADGVAINRPDFYEKYNQSMVLAEI